MENNEWETDEDRGRYKLLVHRNFIGWVIERLEEEGIPCQRTRNNDRKGDILIINPEHVARVKQIISQIQNKYNS